MDEAQLAELQVLRERVVEVQALQVLLQFLHNSRDCTAEQFLPFVIATRISHMCFSLCCLTAGSAARKHMHDQCTVFLYSTQIQG